MIESSPRRSSASGAATRQLEIAQEALLERRARRHELISRLGHELRTPVTVILGMAQTLSKGTAPAEERGQILDSLVDRAHSLARLVQRFEAAVEAGLTEWADVTQVAREVAAMHDRVDRGRRAGTGDGQPQPDRRRVASSKSWWRTASRSRPGTTVTIRVSAEADVPRGARDRPRQRHRPGALDRIFDPLEQGEELNTRTHQGVGLGLTLARMSARAMDGDVVLESTSTERFDLRVDRLRQRPAR